MFHSPIEFCTTWASESAETQKCLDRLTDESLHVSVAAEGRTIGRLAWHLLHSIHEMMGLMGLPVPEPGDRDVPPNRAADIADAYRATAAAVDAAVRHGATEVSLTEPLAMYGETWRRAHALYVMLAHEIHHRAQLTVLMRHAGLTVPGIYGPAREEWATFGMEIPKV